MSLHNAQKGGVKKEREREKTLVRKEGYNGRIKRRSWSISEQGLVRLHWAVNLSMGGKAKRTELSRGEQSKAANTTLKNG